MALLLACLAPQFLFGEGKVERERVHTAEFPADSVTALQGRIVIGDYRVRGESDLEHAQVKVSLSLPDRFTGDTKAFWESWQPRIELENGVLTVNVLPEGPENVVIISGDTVHPEVLVEVVLPREVNTNLRVTRGRLAVSGLSGEQILQTTAAAIQADSVDGPIQARSSTGEIRITGGEGSVQARSSTGTLSISERSGEVAFHSTRGDVTLQKIVGAVEGRTSTGSITLDLVGGSAQLRSVSGDLSVQLPRTPHAPCALRSTSGQIFVSLPEGANLTLSTQSVSGALQNHLPEPFDPATAPRRRSPQTLTLGDGGALLTVETTSGDRHFQLLPDWQ